MHRVLAVALLAMLVSVAHSGGNPDVRMYIDFDPPNYVQEITPELYTGFSAYVCVDQLGEGMTSIAFRLSDITEVVPPVTVPPSFNLILPWPRPITCIPWWPPGAALGGQCAGVGEEVVVIGEVLMFYLGGSGCLEVLYHDEYPGWVGDCSDPWGIDEYCVLTSGSIGGAPCPEGDCPSVPIEHDTWGTIKSLYR